MTVRNWYMDVKPHIGLHPVWFLCFVPGLIGGKISFSGSISFNQFMFKKP